MLKHHRALLEVILIAALFSPSFMLVKIAVQDIPPICLIALRVGIAGMLLWGLLKINNKSLSFDMKTLKHCFILGFFANGFPFVCFSYSLKEISSSLSALINGMTPVITVFLAHLFLKDEPFTLNRALGVILGLCGFSILFLPALFNQEMKFDLLGISLCFIGSCSYAVAAIYTKKYVKNVPFLVAPILQLLTSFLYLMPIALIFENTHEIIHAPLSAWAALFTVALVGTALAFILYHRIVVNHGATALSMSTYLLPVFGAMWGVSFLGETLDSYFILAAFLILSGLAVINGIIPLPILRRA